MTAFLLNHLLERAALASPSSLAVSAEGRSLTYAELNEQSDRVAQCLRSSGVRPGDRVGLLLGKSSGAVVSIYGVLKAGGVYVPLDQNAPPSRLGYILRDCGVRVVLAHPWRSAPPSTPILEDADALDAIVVVDGPRAAAPSGLPAQTVSGWAEALACEPNAATGGNARIDTDLAYILYTSGSTGQPKGVMISHRNALTFVEWGMETFGVSPADRLSNHAPYHFDLSIFDLFVSAAAAASVHLVPDGLSTFPLRLAQWLASERITVWYSVPSVLTLLALHGRLDRNDLSALRLVLFAGEVFPLKHLQALVALLPRPRYFNLYGPTETNVCTYHEVDRLTLSSRTTSLPIGMTCENMASFAVTDSGALVDRPGQTGELLVRGSGVALGYWGRPDRTAAGFVQNPLEPAVRDVVYRTGDLVTLDGAGEYLYLGRADHQIKSRGYRIELGEIETALHDHPLVREAAAVAVPDDLVGNRINAIVALVANAELPASELQAHCAKRLPRYMVPELITFRQELPRTLNGKVDRVRLAAVEA